MRGGLIYLKKPQNKGEERKGEEAKEEVKVLLDSNGEPIEEEEKKTGLTAEEEHEEREGFEKGIDKLDSSLAVREENDIRIAVIGNVDSGKSTLVGVLTKGIMDDGRGSARMKVFNFGHEAQNGRTSSIGQEIMGFDD